MGAFIDKTGMRNGKLVVLGRDPADSLKWICQCDCGRRVSIFRSNLSKPNHSTSCGKCWMVEFPVGFRRHRLTVIEEPFSIGQNPYILCRCDCGNERLVLLSSFRTGYTQSCGCLKTDSTQAYLAKRWANPIDRVGTVMHGIRLTRELGRHPKSHSRIFEGSCVHCGALWTGQERYLTSPRTKGGFCRCQKSIPLRETHKRYRQSKGFAPDSLMTPYNKALRQVTVPLHLEIKRRDNGTCLLCEERSPEVLHAHHVVRVTDDLSRVADPYNIGSLCGDCHVIAHGGLQGGTPDPMIQEQLLAKIRLAESRRPTVERIDLAAMHYEIVNLEKLKSA